MTPVEAFCFVFVFEEFVGGCTHFALVRNNLLRKCNKLLLKAI